MDVFRPRARLPLDPFPVERTLTVPPPSELVLPSPPQVILLLGVPDVRSTLLPLLTSPRLSTCLVIFATHDPSALLPALDSLTPSTPGPSIRILQLSTPLDVHEAGALRLISVLNRAGRVANDWRQQRQNPHERTVLHLLPDSPDGDFCIVKPLTSQLPSPAPSLERSKSKRFSFVLGKSEEPKISNNYPQYYYLSPSRAPRLPSAIDATHEYSRYPSPTSRSNVFVPHANNANTSTRSFDAILNFLPDNIPDKALLKHAILVTTLSAQYLSGAPPSSGVNQDIQTYHAHRDKSLSSPPTPTPTLTLPTPPRAAFLTGKFKSAKPTRRASVVSNSTEIGEKQKRRFSSFISPSSSSSGFPFGFSLGPLGNTVELEPPSELGESSLPRPRVRAGSTKSSADIDTAERKKKNRFSSFIPGYGYSAGFGGIIEDALGGGGVSSASGITPEAEVSSSTTSASASMQGALNAHIVHILPPSWAFESGPSSGSSSSASGSGSSKLNPNNCVAANKALGIASSSRHHHRSSTSTTRNVKPKLVQGIEQFLLGFSSSSSAPSPSSMLHSSSPSPARPRPTPTPTHSPSSSTSTSASASSSSGRPSFSSFSSFSPSPSGSTSTSTTNTPGTTPPASRPASTYGIVTASCGEDAMGKGKGKATASDEAGASRPGAVGRSSYRHSYHAYHSPSPSPPSSSGAMEKMQRPAGTRWSMDDSGSSSPAPAGTQGSNANGATAVVLQDKAAVAAQVIPYLISHAEFVRKLGCAGCEWVEGCDEGESGGTMEGEGDSVDAEVKAEEEEGVEGDVEGSEVESDEQDEDADEEDGEEQESSASGTSASSHRSQSNSKSNNSHGEREQESSSSSAATTANNALVKKPITTGEAILLGLLDSPSPFSSPSLSSSPSGYLQRAWIGRGDVVLSISTSTPTSTSAPISTSTSNSSEDVRPTAAATSWCCAHAYKVWKVKEEEKREEERRKRVKARARARAKAKARAKARAEEAREMARAEEAQVQMKEGRDVQAQMEEEEAEEKVEVHPDLDGSPEEIEEKEDAVVGLSITTATTTTTADVVEEEENVIEEKNEVAVDREKEKDVDVDVNANAEVVVLETENEKEEEEKDVDVNETTTQQQLPTPPESRSGCSGEEDENGEDMEDVSEGDADADADEKEEEVACAPAQTTAAADDNVHDEEEVVEENRVARRAHLPTPSASPSRSSSMILAVKLGAELDAQAGVCDVDAVLVNSDLELEREIKGADAVAVAHHEGEGEGERKGEPMTGEEKQEIVVSSTSTPDSDPIVQPAVKSKSKSKLFGKIQRSLSLSSRLRSPASVSPALSTAASGSECGVAEKEKEKEDGKGKGKEQAEGEGEEKPRRSISFRTNLNLTSEVRNSNLNKEKKKKWNLGMARGISIRRSGSERAVGVGVEA